jgi:hypothetical protein
MNNLIIFKNEAALSSHDQISSSAHQQSSPQKQPNAVAATEAVALRSQRSSSPHQQSSPQKQPNAIAATEAVALRSQRSSSPHQQQSSPQKQQPSAVAVNCSDSSSSQMLMLNKLAVIFTINLNNIVL